LLGNKGEMGVSSENEERKRKGNWWVRAEWDDQNTKQEKETMEAARELEGGKRFRQKTKIETHKLETDTLVKKSCSEIVAKGWQ